MNTKLTLKLNKKVIDRAKSFAKARRTSLSSLVENYFRSLGEEGKSNEEISPIVRELSGIIELPESFDIKKEYTDYLLQKY